MERQGGKGNLREYKVNQSKSKTSNQCILFRSTSLSEDSRRVKGDNVDTTHLLTNHNDERGESCSTKTGNGEELSDSRQVVTLTDDCCFNLELAIDKVKITSGKKIVLAKSAEGIVGFSIFSSLHQPSGGFYRDC